MTLIKPINIGIIGLASIARKQIIPAIYSLKKHYKLKAISSKKNKDTYDLLFKQFTNI